MQCIKAKLDKLHDTEQFLSPDLLFACNWKKKIPIWLMIAVLISRQVLKQMI